MTFEQGTTLRTFKLGIEKGTLQLDQVIDWADRQIAIGKGGSLVFDLSLAKNSGINHAIHCLGKWGMYPNDPDLVKSLTLGLIRKKFDKGDLTLNRAAYTIEETLIEFENTNYLEIWGMSLDDIFFLATRDGIMEPKDIREKVYALTDKSFKLTNDFLAEIGIEV